MLRLPCFVSAFALALVCGTAATNARATVTEPNGLMVPGLSSVGTEIPLSTLFVNRGEPINWQTDANATPDTFSPLCDFSASLVMKQSGSSLAVGWYNVVPNATSAPLSSEIYMVVPAGSPVGSTVNGATIRNDARYKGGSVGFALIRTPANYSEQKWNTLCSGCVTPGRWTLSVAYKSVLTPNAYYLAFEDGDTSTFGWTNDGDFNDYVFFFTGLACAGAGVPCSVPNKIGACAQGFTECDGSGVLACKQVAQPDAEKCDGVDNDCNGTADEGDLCPVDNVCSKGKCVRNCGGSEFTCAPGTVCNAGLCVDPACADVTCPDGELCTAGECKAACAGVVCPASQVCRVGRCVDPCAGVTCGAGRVCESGVCVTSCACQACGASLTCSTGSGKCVESACANVTCAPATTCVAGACVDSCQGVVCPAGQACLAGECADVPVSEQDAGGLDPGLDPGGEQDASGGGPGADGGAGAGATPDPGFGSGRTSGCGCRVAENAGNASPLLLVLAAVGSAFARRKARRRS